MFNLGTAVVKTVMDMAGITQGIQQSQGIFARASGTLTGIGTKLTAGLTLPIVAAGAAALNTAVDFDSAMMGVNSVLKLPAESFANLTDRVLHFSTTTSKSSKDVALALHAIAASGFETEDAFTILKVAVDSAGNMMTDTGVTTAALTTVLHAFGMEVSDVTHVADVMQTAANNSAVEFDQLSSGIGDAAGMAAASNVSFETLVAGIMTARDPLGSTSESIVAMRNLLQEILAPSENFAGAIHDWGYESGQAALDTIGLEGVMDKLRETTGGSSSEVIALLGNIRAGKAAFALMRDDGAALAESLEEVGAASEGVGEHAAMADIRHQSWAYHITKLKSEIEVFAIRLSNLLAPSIIEVVDVLKDWFTALAQASPETLKFIAIVAGIAAAAGPVLIILGALAGAIGALGVAFLPVIAIIAAIALGIAWLVTNFDTVKVAVEKVKVVIAELPGILADLLGKDRIAALGEGFTEFAAGVTDTFEVVRNWVATHWPEIQTVIVKVMTAIQSIVNAIVSAVVPFVVDMFQKIVDWFNANWPLIQATVETVLDAIWAVIQAVIGAIETFWAAHGEKIVRVASLIWDNIKLMISTVLDTILGIIKAVMQAITGDWEGAWETIKEIAINAWEAFWQYIENMWNMVLALFGTSLSDLKEKIATAFENILSGIAEWWENLKATWSDNWDMILEIVSTIWENIVTSVTEWFSGLIESIFGKGEEIQTGWTDLWNSVLEFASQIWLDIKVAILEVLVSLFSSMGMNFFEFAAKWNDLWERVKVIIITVWNRIVTWVTTKITALVVEIATRLQEIHDTWSAIWEDVKTIITTIWMNIIEGITEWALNLQTIIVTKLQEIKDTWSAIWEDVKTIITTIWTNIVEGVTEWITEVQTKISTKLDEIKTTWSGIWESIKTIFSTIWSSIVLTVGSKLNEIKTRITTKLNEALDVIFGFRDRFVTKGRQLIEGMREGIENAFAGILSFVYSAIDSVISTIEDALGIESPSKVMADIGELAGKGFEIGIMDALGRAAGMVGNTLGDLTVGTEVGNTFSAQGTLSPVAVGAGAAMHFYGDLHLHGVEDPQTLLEQLQEFSG